MRVILSVAVVALVAATNYAFGQVLDEDIRGPARRAAGAASDALGAPGVNDRIERREDRREAITGNPDRWRMRYYNNEWWYYTPQNQWMYYRDSRWTPFDGGHFRALPQQRYSTGYRGTYTSRMDRFDRNAYDRTTGDRFAYGRSGPPTLTIEIHDGRFEPASINIPAGTTVHWINRGAEDHTVTADNGSWDSGELGPDGSYSARFRQPGTYQYHCDLHAQMVGTIAVGEAASGAIEIKPGGADVNINRQGVNVDVPARAPGANPPAEPGVQPATPAEAERGSPSIPRPRAPVPAPGTTP